MGNGRTLIVNLISGERLSLDCVTRLTADGDIRAYYADMASGYRVFFNADLVIYIGFEEDVSGMIERSWNT